MNTRYLVYIPMLVALVAALGIFCPYVLGQGPEGPPVVITGVVEVIHMDDFEHGLHKAHHIVTDLKTPGIDGLALLEIAKKRAPHAVVIVISAVDSVDAAIAALKAGADDFIPKPVNLNELTERIESSLQRRAMAEEIAALHSQLNKQQGLESMIGTSAAMRALFEKIRLVATNPQLRIQMALAARRTVEERFSFARMVDEIENVFCDLLKTRQKPQETQIKVKSAKTTA